MNEVNVLESLSQASLSDVSQVLSDHMRSVIKESLLRLMFEEASQLCGGFYHPDKNSKRVRAGSAKGAYTLNGVKESVVRPRVRVSGASVDGEVDLVSYKAAKNADKVRSMIIKALGSGVSSNDVSRLFPGAAASSSQASRLWVKEGLAMLEKLRGRDLSGEDFFCLMIDGIHLGSDVMAVAALGITTDGRKMMLDFEIGASENKEVCDTLLRRLSKRGFKDNSSRRLLVVLDGSEALKSSVISHFDNPIMQRCVIHKERNIRSYLSKRHHGELARLFSTLRKAEGAEAGREAVSDIRDFLKGKSKNALASLEECGEDLIALHVIGAPSTLNKTLLNTNCIENAFNNVRRKIGRVKRWRSDTDQAERWMAFGMLEAERGFRRINNSTDIGELLEKLKRF
jgi:transposase-like protein